MITGWKEFSDLNCIDQIKVYSVVDFAYQAEMRLVYLQVCVTVNRKEIQIEITNHNSYLNTKRPSHDSTMSAALWLETQSFRLKIELLLSNSQI